MQLQNTVVRSITASPENLDVIIISVLEAPRALTFETITDPSRITRWWGPSRFKTKVDKMTVKPGGEWRFIQQGSDGKEYAFSGVFQEVDPPEKYSYSWNFESAPKQEHFETIIFQEQGDVTKVTNTVHFQSIEDRQEMLKTGLITGSIETMDRLSELLKEIQNQRPTNEPSTMMSQEINVTRVFAAPLELIWKMWTDPESIKQWWGPKDFTAPTVTVDFRTGGEFVLCMRGPGRDGVTRDYWNVGRYVHILPMEKIVMTLSFADEQGNPVPASDYGMPGNWPKEVTLICTFEKIGDNITRLTLKEVGVPPEMIESRYLGWEQSMEKIDEYLSELKVLDAVIEGARKISVEASSLDYKPE